MRKKKNIFGGSKHSVYKEKLIHSPKKRTTVRSSQAGYEELKPVKRTRKPAVAFGEPGPSAFIEEVESGGESDTELLGGQEAEEQDENPFLERGPDSADLDRLEYQDIDYLPNTDFDDEPTFPGAFEPRTPQGSPSRRIELPGTPSLRRDRGKEREEEAVKTEYHTPEPLFDFSQVSAETLRRETEHLFENSEVEAINRFIHRIIVLNNLGFERYPRDLQDRVFAQLRRNIANNQPIQFESGTPSRGSSALGRSISRPPPLVFIPATATMANRNMPSRGSRSAPMFDESHPEELPRFFDDLEALFREHNVTGNADKKNWVVRYVPFRVEQQWKRFPSFGTGGYPDLKKEILNDYPDAANLNIGSLARLKQVCKENQRIGEGDLKELLSFKRQFEVEAYKLKEAPILLANHTLVGYFMGCLTEAFRNRVYASLDIMTSTAKGVRTMLEDATIPGLQLPPKTNQRLEDPYELKDVIAKALELARALNPGSEDLGTFSGQSVPLVPPVKVKVESNLQRTIDELAQDMALIKDFMTNTERQQKFLANEVKTFAQIAHAPPVSQMQLEGQSQAAPGTAQSSHNKPFDQQPERPYQERPYQERPNYNQPYSRDNGGGQNRGYGFGREGYRAPARLPPVADRGTGSCHYCHQSGHFMFECLVKNQHLQEGKVKVGADGRLRLPDGSLIPWDPAGNPMRKAVEEYAMRNSLVYSHGNDAQMSSNSSSYSYSSRDPKDELIDQLRQQMAELEFKNQFAGESLSQPPMTSSHLGVSKGTATGTADMQRMFAAWYAETQQQQDQLDQFASRKTRSRTAAEQGFPNV